MVMTGERMKRFDVMVRDFTDTHSVRARIKHEYEKHQTEIVFEPLQGRYERRDIIVLWDDKTSLTQACTAIFTYIIREWNLDGKMDDSFTVNDKIKNVIFNDPATIVLWKDGTKTIVKCQDGDLYSKETGLALCIAKKALGNKSNFNNVFKKWIPEEETVVKLSFNPLENAGQRFIDELSEKIEDVLKRHRDRGVHA